MTKRKSPSTLSRYVRPLSLVLGLWALVWLSNQVYTRVDLTADGRYSLSHTTTELISRIDRPMVFRVFLGGDLPSGFQRLQYEVRQMMRELYAQNDNIQYIFVDPYEADNPKKAEENVRKLSQMGLSPTNLQFSNKGQQSSKLIFPWVVVQDSLRGVRIPLLKTQMGASSEQQINASIENLEFAFAQGIQKILWTDKPIINFIRGHDEVDDLYLSDIASELSPYYTLMRTEISIDEKDEVALHPDSIAKVQLRLNQSDLVIVARPVHPFNYTEKYILDQYFMDGGSIIWLTSDIHADMESLRSTGSQTILYNDLGIKDMLFKYGVRIRPSLLQDLNAAPMRIALGSVGRNPTYQNVPWHYHPLIVPDTVHPIVRNIDLIKTQFPSVIDTLATSSSSPITKTPLLVSSPYTRLQSAPSEVRLSSVQDIDPATFQGGQHIVGVLLEGGFESAFKGRVKVKSAYPFLERSPEGHKMVVIADGHLVSNEVHKGKSLPLGFDKWINQQYGNKDFVLNTINYLLGNDQLMNTRTRTIDIRRLDPIKIENERSYWQMINLVIPICFIGLIALFFFLYRKKAYR